ncbi:TPA: hypothetical protein I8303_003477 [Aeromonas hydrophila]|nr:hypothetical protein [Aeromonas hydrophila]
MNNTHSHTPYAKPERSNIITYILGPDSILLGTGLKSFWRRDAERHDSSELPYVVHDMLYLILRQAKTIKKPETPKLTTLTINHRITSLVKLL